MLYVLKSPLMETTKLDLGFLLRQGMHGQPHELELVVLFFLLFAKWSTTLRSLVQNGCKFRLTLFGDQV